jgi:multiple sugar transport system substrate-binding protein
MNKKMVRFLTLAGMGALALASLAATAQSGRSTVVWFVGVGTGGQPAQIEGEKAAVERFNKSSEKIQIDLQIVDYNSARDNLSARIAAGNPPEIVGPVGNSGANWFKGQWVDLDPLIAKYKPDLSGFEPALLKFYKESQEGTGLPYAVYPSFIFFNKALFDEAKLPYPPTKVGEKYQGQTWDWNAMRRLSMKLTYDSKGRSATQAGFDAKNIVTFGFINQWTTDYVTSIAAQFKPTALYNAKTGKAVVDPSTVTALRWYYNGIWKDHFIPNQDAQNSDLLGRGNPFNSGNVAMGFSHLWYTCCLDAGKDAKVKDWGVAVVPSYNGKTTAKLHADTFRMMKGAKNQDAAFQAMMWIMKQKDLFTTYGAFPADVNLQDDYISAVNKKYAGVKINWTVIQDMLKYVDTPSHEAYMPNFTKAGDIQTKLLTKIMTLPNLDLAKEVSDFKAEMQRAFDEKK